MENGETTIEGLTKQLKEILPGIIDAKDVLGQAKVDSATLKDLSGKIQAIEGNVLKMDKAIVEIGQKHIVVHGAPIADEQKIDFCKWVIALSQSRRGAGEAQRKVFGEMMDKYGDTAQKAALNETTSGEGGYLVPRLFAKEIMRVAEGQSVAMRMGTKKPLTTGYKLPVIREASAVSVSWIAESGAISGAESEPTFAEDLVAAKKMMAFSKISNELLEDEDVGLYDYLVMIFGEAVGQEIDNQAFTGTGTVFTGALRATGVNSVTMTAGQTFASIDFDYLSNVIAQLKQSSLQGAWFFMHRSIINTLRKAKLNSTYRDWFPPANGQPGTIWGYPYEIVEKMPSVTAFTTPFVLFGNPKYIYIGEKERDMTVKVSDLPYIANDQSMFLIRKRIAIDVALPSAFSVLKTGAAS